MPAYCGRIFIHRLSVRLRRAAGIDSQKTVASPAWMNVDVEMWDFLKCGRPDRVPQAQTLVRKRQRDSSCYTTDGCHERGAGGLIQFADVCQMGSRNDECVPRMELASVDKGHCYVVFVHHTRGTIASRNITENASCGHGSRPLPWFEAALNPYSLALNIVAAKVSSANVVLLKRP